MRADGADRADTTCPGGDGRLTCAGARRRHAAPGRGRLAERSRLACPPLTDPAVTPPPTPWILFADIDGTLWCGSERTAVLRRRMERAGEVARVVLASSRTIEEILDLQARLATAGDFIAENGAQLVVRSAALALALGDCEPGPGPAGNAFVRHFAAPLVEILPAVLAAARRHHLEATLAATPGWPGAPPSASSPPFRRASLLLPRRLFAGGAHAPFLAEVRAAGLEVVDGGEWTAISRGASKGRAAAAYADLVRSAEGRAVRTAAVGNSDNDASLMEAVERPLVIRNPEGHPETLARLPGAILLNRLACAGWHEAVALLRKEVS